MQKVISRKWWLIYWDGMSIKKSSSAAKPWMEGFIFHMAKSEVIIYFKENFNARQWFFFVALAQGKAYNLLEILRWFEINKKVCVSLSEWHGSRAMSFFGQSVHQFSFSQLCEGGQNWFILAPHNLSVTSCETCVFFLTKVTFLDLFYNFSI